MLLNKQYMPSDGRKAMSTVDSNDKAKQNDKAFYEKKEKNDRQFVELCYKELYTAINMHHSVMKYIAEAREQALNEAKKKLQQEKEEASFSESMKNYNEALNKMLAKETRTDSSDLIDRIKSFLNSIIKQIEELKAYIHELDQKISKLSKNIKNIKSELADEMKKIFIDSNPSITIRSQSFIASFPTLFHDKNDKENDIVKILYLRFANMFAEQLDQIKMEEMIAHGKQLASEVITNYLLSKGIPITQDIKNQIDILASQFAMQLPRDMAKNPVLASKIEEICRNEREIEKINIEKQSAEIQISKLESICINVAQCLDPQNIISLTEAKSILVAAEVACAEVISSKNPFATAAIAALDKTDECVSKAEDIIEQAKAVLTDDAASTKLTEFASEIQQIASTHQKSLAEGLDDFFANDDTPTPPQPTSTHTLS